MTMNRSVRQKFHAGQLTGKVSTLVTTDSGICALIFSASLRAEVVPDRPGFSTGTYTVQPGSFQLELGTQESRSDDVWTFPLLNFRTGITDKAELNIYWDGVTYHPHGSHETSSWMLGMKYRLIESEHYNWSLLGFISYEDQHFLPFIGLLWDKEINSKLGLFGTIQLQQTISSGSVQSNFQPAIGLSYAISQEVNVYSEFREDFSLDRSDMSEFIGGGVAWLITPDIQVDFNFELSTSQFDDIVVGVGYAQSFKF